MEVWVCACERAVLAQRCLQWSTAPAGYVTGLMHYVGQQHRERQGWGKKDEAEQCVRLHVSMHECAHTSAFARFCGPAVGTRTSRGLHPAVQTPNAAAGCRNLQRRRLQICKKTVNCSVLYVLCNAAKLSAHQLLMCYKADVCTSQSSPHTL